MVTIEVISAVLILLFSYTAISKLIDHRSFQFFLRNIVSGNTGADVLSLLIPSVEICTALLLFFSSTRVVGLYASMVLLSMFTLYLIWMILFVPRLPCSCGGVISRMSWKWHVVFNLFFVGMSVVGIIKIRSSLTTDSKRSFG